MNFKNELLESAFDFLNRSVDVLEDHPKYSIIFFSTSLELFIKAKLAEEHWILVLKDPKRANIDKLHSGNFRSVSLLTGIKRIENILNEKLTKKQKTLFETISNHRNQIIHFYHQEYADSTKKEVVQSALRDLSEGWYYSANILNNWENIFPEDSSEIEEFSLKLKKKGHLLKGKFHSLKDEIEKQKDNGKEVIGCKVCNFKSAISTSIVQNL